MESHSNQDIDLDTVGANFELLKTLKVDQKLIVDANSKRLTIDKRWVPFIRRRLTGDSKLDILAPIEQTFEKIRIYSAKETDKDYLVKDPHEIGVCLKNMEETLLSTYSNFGKLHGLVEKIRNKVYNVPFDYGTNCKSLDVLGSYKSLKKNHSYAQVCIPVDTRKSYMFSVDLMMKNTKKHIAIGLRCLTDSGETIHHYNDQRIGNPVTFEKYDSQSRTITTNGPFLGWHGDKKAYKYFGVYLDGDDTKLPDFVGVFEALQSNNSIVITESGGHLKKFEKLLVKNLLKPGITKIANHFSGTAWSYCSQFGAPDASYGDDWFTCTGVIKGITTWYDKDRLQKFAKNTRYVEPVVFCHPHYEGEFIWKNCALRPVMDTT